MSRLFARRASLWFLLAMLPASSLWAQPAAEPPALVPVPADREIIPYELSEKPEDSKRVYLPWKQFHELWVKAHPEQVPQLAAPVAGQLAEALYSAELPDKAQAMGDSLTIQGRLVYYVLQQGQVTLPLPLGAVAMEQAQVNGEQAVIVPTPGEAAAQNPLSVVFDQPGVYVVDLRFRVKVRQTGPAGAVTLPLTAVPAGTFRLKTPAGALQYRVNGSSQGFRKVQDADQPALIVPISAGGNVTVAWRPPQEAQDTESFVQAESVTAVIVTDQGLRLQAQQKLQVRQGGINEVVFSFPEPLALRTLSGADVGGWQIEGEGAERTLTVFLRRKVDDGTQLRFDLFLKQSADDMETQYAIPDFAPKSVARETGTIAVLAPRQFSIRLGDSTGLQQIEATQVPWQQVVADVSVPEVPQFAFRFTRRPLQWSLVVQRRQPQLTLLAEHLAALSPRRIQQTNKFHFELKGAPRSELLIVLPQGYLPQQIQAPDVTDWHISGRDNAAEMDAEALLHLDLGTPRTGPVEVTLIGKLLRDPHDTQVQVALPYALEAEDYVSHALVTIDPIYEAKTGELDTWRSVDPAGMFSAWFSRTVTGRPMAFTTNAPAPAPFELNLKQAQPRLSADALTIVTVQEQALEYLVALQWRITSAGADTFVFTTPQWLADHLEFPEVATPRIRSVHKEPPLDGVVRWTITLEDPQRDRLFLAARATLPPSAQGEVRAPRIVFEQAAPAGAVQPFTPLELQKQYAVLVNRSATQLTRAPADGVEAIAADDLLQVVKLRQDLLNEAAELLRFNDPSAVVTWKQQRFQAEQLLPASVNLAQHVTVLALDGSWRSVSHFRLKNRSRQFLPLRLPADSQILSIIVRDEPGTAVQPPAPAVVTLVPLPKTVEGDVSFMVQLVLAGRLPSGPLARRWSLWPQTVQIPVPQILSTEEDPALGIPVAQTTWTVYVPEATDVWFVHDPNAMNVTPGSEAVTQLDELSALMQEMSDLVNVNSSSGNRRAQAQSLNNLKYLNPLVQKAVEQQQQTPSKGGRNAEQEEARKAELVQRAKRLEKTVEEVFRFNEDKGLQVNTDSLGNNYIVDNKQEASQKDRFSQLYSDNTPTVTATPEDMPALNQPEAKPSAGKSQSLGREALREQSRAQVQELSKKNAEKLSNRYDNAASKVEAQDYLIANGPGSGQMDGQPQSKELHFQNPFQSQGDSGVAAGPRRDLQRRGDYPKLGTIVGLAQSNTFHPDLDGAIQGHGGGGGMGGAGGPGVAGPGPGGMPGGGTPVLDPAGNALFGGRGLERSLDAFDGGLSQALGVKGWTATGGLSLPLQIPQTGKAWYFSKVGGGPVLTLALRPHQTLQTLFGLLWTVASGTLLAVLVWLLRRSSDWRVWNRWLPWCLTAVGLSLYCLLPVNTSLAGLSFLMLLIGLVWLAANWRPRTTASTR